MEVRLTKKVSKWLGKLPVDHRLNVLSLMKMLEVFGNKLDMPASKMLGGGLYELRDIQYGYRLYYTFKGKDIVLLIYSGNKSTQKRDIALAKKLLKKA